MGELTRYVPPTELAPELRREVDHLIAGPVRLPGIEADDPGMLLTPEPAYHPGAEAEAEADARRAALAQPATPEMIRDWLELIAASVANTPDDKAISLRLSVLALYDDLPAPVWTSRRALREAIAAFKFWPSGAEMVELQRRQREIFELERIAKGDHVRRGPARESTVPYVLPMPPPEKPAHPSMPKREPSVGDLVRIDPAEVARQIAPLGGVLPNTDLLAARREALELKLLAAPEAPAPLLKVVK
jgi:hypothetical protein